METYGSVRLAMLDRTFGFLTLEARAKVASKLTGNILSLRCANLCGEGVHVFYCRGKIKSETISLS